MNKMKKCWLVTFVVAFGCFAQGALAQERNQEFPRDIHGLYWQPADPGRLEEGWLEIREGKAIRADEARAHFRNKAT